MQPTREEKRQSQMVGTVLLFNDGKAMEKCTCLMGLQYALCVGLFDCKTFIMSGSLVKKQTSFL